MWAAPFCHRHPRRWPIRVKQVRLEQLVVSARATLVQVQNILETQSNEGARRLREAQVAFITTRRDRSSSTSTSHDSVLDGQEPDQQASGRQSSPTERITPSEDIPLLKLPFEAGCGVMMLQEKSE